nr:MAG TPA: hypothetical protein [Caudoviricetes sp.]
MLHLSPQPTRISPLREGFFFLPVDNLPFLLVYARIKTRLT